MSRGERIVEDGHGDVAQKLKKTLADLEDHWRQVGQLLAEHGTQLLEASQLSMDFQNRLNSLMSWLTNMEHHLNSLTPVSRLFGIVVQEKENHKVCSLFCHSSFSSFLD